MHSLRKCKKFSEWCLGHNDLLCSQCNRAASRHRTQKLAEIIVVAVSTTGISSFQGDLTANYIYYLLVHGYKFDSESWPQIQFQKEVGNSSIAWSLGYMLNLTNMIPAERPLILLPLRPTVFAGLLFLFATISLLCLIFLVVLLIRAC
ncbi:hypothetical protein AB205_0041340 [Aquarana catesbeiana]|uniref:Uncharacterized protein n=1 Tax=Aquarana catesbeiana TaxID=8400 RepID=A0A2G9RUT4_AQUCT|nr:hypothetical protein AB205_0041340 [Aquarana catesbeiana]